MLLPRTSALIVGGGLLAALIASPTLVRHGAREMAPPAAAGASQTFPDIEPKRLLLPALQAKVGQTSANAAVSPGRVSRARNPFVFASRPQPAPPAGRPAPPAIVAAPEPLLPRLSLTGIADDTSTGTSVRTAVLSIGGQIYLVKEGENATARFTAIRITADVVELRDETTGNVVRLALR
jgi:hypothetical protein